MDNQSARVGVDALYIAKLLTDTLSGATYDTPIKIPGVASIGVQLNNSDTILYADDGAYESFNQEGDKKITLSLAGLSAEVRASIIGGTYTDSNGLIVDSKGDSKDKYAVMFRSQKGNGEYRYITYSKGTFSKPDETFQSKSGSVAPQTPEYMFTALNRIYDGKWRQSIDSDDENCPIGLTAALLNNASTGWFSSPDYTPVAPGTPISDLSASSGSGSGEIDVTFSAPSGATSVKLQVEDAALGVWHDATTSAALTATSTAGTITGLTGGNTYTVRLVVIGGSSNGISNTDTAAAGTGA